MDVDALALQTLCLIEQRLERLEYLTGDDGHDDDDDEASDPPVAQRVQKLQQSLNKLAAKHQHIADLLRLRKFSRL
jgi:hypothetical protein